MVPYVTKVQGPSPKTGALQTMMTCGIEASEKTKAALSGLRPLSRVLVLDDADMIALPTQGAGFEEPACEGPVRC